MDPPLTNASVDNQVRWCWPRHWPCRSLRLPVTQFSIAPPLPRLDDLQGCIVIYMLDHPVYTAGGAADRTGRGPERRSAAAQNAMLIAEKSFCDLVGIIRRINKR